MNRITYHLIIPSILAIVFFIIATTPVEVLGCRTRGLIALLIALISGLSAFGTAIVGAKGRMRGDGDATWWVASSIILIIPVIALIIMA
jgi:ATP/ADP translocase